MNYACVFGCCGTCPIVPYVFPTIPGSRASHWAGVRLQFGEANDPQGVFHFKASKRGGFTAKEINQTLREHLDFQAVRDVGDTDAVVVEQTFDALDTNYDDSLSRAEFLSGALGNSPGSRDSLVDIFTTVDKDGNGEISRSEFITAANGSQEMLGLNPKFRLADFDADGFLSQEEFFFTARQFYPLEWQTSEVSWKIRKDRT